MRTLVFIIFTVLLAGLSFGQDIVVASIYPGELQRYNVATGSKSILYRDRHLISQSLDPNSMEVYTLDESTHSLLIVDSIGGIESFPLPPGEALIVSYASKGEAYITFKDNRAYHFVRSTSTFTELDQRVTSAVFQSDNYLVLQSSPFSVTIFNRSDSTLQTLRDLGSAQLRGALYDQQTEALVFVVEIRGSTLIYKYDPENSTPAPVLIASSPETFRDLRSSPTSKSFYFTKIGNPYQLTASQYDITADEWRTVASIPYGLEVDFSDVDGLRTVLLTDYTVGWIVDYSISDQRQIARIPRPLSAPTALRYVESCNCVYVLNKPAGSSPGGSVYRFDLSGNADPKVIVEPQPFNAAGGLMAFEVDAEGNLLTAFDDSPNLYRRACDTCASEILSTNLPSWQSIYGMATAKFLDSIYLLTNGEKVYVRSNDGEVRYIGLFRETGGGDFRVDEEAKYAYGYRSLNENLPVLDLKTGIRTNVIPNSISCIMGVSRQDEEGKVHLLYRSHANGDISYSTLDLETATLSAASVLPIAFGPLALVSSRSSNIWEEQVENLAKINVQLNLSGVSIELPEGVQELTILDAAGKRVLTQKLSGRGEGHKINISSAELASGWYVVMGRGKRVVVAAFVMP